MAIAHTRKIGSESGVQLNQPIDNTQGFTATNGISAFATAGVFKRGRVDRAFKVRRNDYKRLLGTGLSPSVEPLHEVYLHIYEAFKKGAQEAVISRYQRPDAQVQYVAISGIASTNGAVSSVTNTMTLAAFVSGSQNNIIKFDHKECFDEGIVVKINADVAYDDGGYEVSSKMVTVKLVEVGTGVELYSFYGSLDPLATDAYGNSIFLSDVVANTTDNVELVVAEDAEVETTAYYYGKDESGARIYSEETLIPYTAGTASLTSTEYDAGIDKLRHNQFFHRYFISAGEQSMYAVKAMGAIGIYMNRPFLVDVPVGKNVAQAAAWVASLMPELQSHFIHVYWTPLSAKNPLTGGKNEWGSSGLQVGYRCARNAVVDANGIPAMNEVIAGKDYPVDRSNITQLVTITDVEDGDLTTLADARINPVIFETYNTGSAYVFRDSLTCVAGELSTKLIAVSEMSSQIDDWLASESKAALQKPMLKAIRHITNFAEKLFTAVQTAEWITPSVELDGSSFVFEASANPLRPYEKMDEKYSVHYDGTVRVVEMQQTISK